MKTDGRRERSEDERIDVGIEICRERERWNSGCEKVNMWK